LNPEVQHRISTLPDRVTHIDRIFVASDLDTEPPPALVLCAVDDPVASTLVYKECQARRIPANIADVPPECDFYFGSIHRQGPLQIMVSTNGQGPRMAALVRRWIAKNLPINVGDAVQKVGVLRQKLRELSPNIEDGAKRMGWMSKVCNTWSLEALCAMTEQDMERLLTFYGSNEVPGSKQIQGKEKAKEDQIIAFDGSFGWSI
jgi:precorrin-2 dehydrogenase/sirohydrochlorin ferrochelatase